MFMNSYNCLLFVPVRLMASNMFGFHGLSKSGGSTQLRFYVAEYLLPSQTLHNKFNMIYKEHNMEHLGYEIFTEFH